MSRENLPGAQEFVRIDHHVSAVTDLGPALVDTHAAAAGELVFALLPPLEAKLTPEIATCLQTALMVDTGRFSYTNTTPTTLRIAAELVGAGADLPTIVDWIWGRVKLSAAKLLGVAHDLAASQRRRTNRLGRTARRGFPRAPKRNPEDTDGIIDHVRSRPRCPQVAALFSEKRGEIRVSLRSQGQIDVAQLARQFGGGGHVKAAGMSFDGPIEYAICDVLHAIEAALQQK